MTIESCQQLPLATNPDNAVPTNSFIIFESTAVSHSGFVQLIINALQMRSVPLFFSLSWCGVSGMDSRYDYHSEAEPRLQLQGTGCSYSFFHKAM